MWRTNKAISSTNFIDKSDLYIGQRVWYGVPDFTKSMNKSVNFVFPSRYKITSPYLDLTPLSGTDFVRRRYSPIYRYGDYDAFYETEEEMIKAWNINITGIIDEVVASAERSIIGRLSKRDYFEKNYIKPEHEELIISQDTVSDTGVRKTYFVTSCVFGTQLVSYLHSGTRNFSLERSVESGTYGNSIYNTAWYDSNSAVRGYLQHGLKEEIGRIEEQRDYFIKKVSKYFIK